MSTAQVRLLKWSVEPAAWNDLSELQRNRYTEIAASYGGTGRLRREFQQYRVAEICARSIRIALGVDTTVAPGRGA